LLLVAKKKVTLSLFLILKSHLRLRLFRFLSPYLVLPAPLVLMAPRVLMAPPAPKARLVMMQWPLPHLRMERLLRLRLSNSYFLNIVRDHNELFFREEKFSSL